ncbi:MAG: reverse transcriptase domain-containing protein [Patescibacteria group bacterium]
MANLTLAWRKARKGKTRKKDVIEFERDLIKNLLALHHELKNKIYQPMSLTTFVLRDPKTRVISKSNFRDRVVHHALIEVIEPIFKKGFIYDSCANQIGKGTLFALKRFDHFKRKATKNNKRIVFCLKADIKHYFDEVDHNILLSIISRKISDKAIIWLINRIINANSEMKRERERVTFARACL